MLIFLSKVILSELKIEESDITTLNSFYKNEFTEESWRKICFFEMHFMREGDTIYADISKNVAFKFCSLMLHNYILL